MKDSQGHVSNISTSTLVNAARLLVCTVILCLSSCSKGPGNQTPDNAGTAPEPSPLAASKAEYKKVIGLSIAGSDACYNAAADVFIHYAKAEGWKVLKSDSQYNKDKEDLNVDEYIAKKVDAVVMVTTDIETAGRNTLKLNESDIPVFFFMTLPNFPENAQPTGVVTTDWYMTGYLNGEYIAKHQPNARCAMIEGGYDQGMTELMRSGFLQGLKSYPGSNAQVVTNVTGSWMKPNAMVAMEELLRQPESFDCIFTGNEEMMSGVIEVLEKNNMLARYKLYSENGRQDVSGKYIRNNVMTATADAATTQEGDIVFQMVKSYFEGKPIPGHVYSPVKLLTKDNIDSAIPWDANEYIALRASGTLNRNLDSMQIVSEPRKWSKKLNNYDNVYFHK